MTKRPSGTTDRCTRKDCLTLMVPSIDQIGRVTFVCPPCERNARGLCIDCPATLPILHKWGRGRRRRCDSCRLKHYAKKRNEDYHRRPDHYRAIKRKSSRRLPVLMRQRRYNKEWLKAHPYQGTVYERMYAREYMRTWLTDPKNRDRVNKRRRRRAAAKRAEVVARGEHKRLYPKPFGPRRKAA